MSELQGSFKIALGSQATDSITGFTGTVTGRCEYLTGCTTYLLAPKCKEDGSAIDGRWFDEDRLTGTFGTKDGGDIEPPVK